MKVVLFKVRWLKPKEALIGLFTVSNFSHAGLLLDDERCVLDASESRGTVDFGRALRDHGKRKVLVYDIGKDEQAERYARSMIGTRYDWRGVMGWPFGFNNPRTVYCFEYALAVLENFKKLGKFSTPELFNKTGLSQKINNKRIDSDDIIGLLERAQLKPIHDGRADEYSYGLAN